MRALHDLAVTGPVAGQSHSQPSDPPTVHVCRNFSPKPRTSSSMVIREGYSTTHPFLLLGRPSPNPALTQPCNRLCKHALIAAVYMPGLFALCSVKAAVEGSCWVLMTLVFGQADLSECSGSVTCILGSPPSLHAW